jgi:hypothetical protein
MRLSGQGRTDMANWVKGIAGRGASRLGRSGVKLFPNAVRKSVPLHKSESEDGAGRVLAVSDANALTAERRDLNTIAATVASRTLSPYAIRVISVADT